MYFASGLPMYFASGLPMYMAITIATRKPVCRQTGLTQQFRLHKVGQRPQSTFLFQKFFDLFV